MSFRKDEGERGSVVLIDNKKAVVLSYAPYSSKRTEPQVWVRYLDETQTFWVREAEVIRTGEKHDIPKLFS